MTIKIAHIADSHFDERGRLQDTIDVHRAFLKQAREAKVDMILHAGDWFERRSTPAERIAVADFLEEAMHVAPVFGVRGNHDVDLDLSLFPRLDLGGDGVIILDRPTAMPGTGKLYWLGDHARAVHPVGGGKGNLKLGLLALPWFDKANLVAQFEATADQEQTRQLTIAAAQELLTCLRTEATRLRDGGAIPILVAHVLIAGSEVSTGQTLIGTTVELSPNDLLDIGASYVALGHIHKSQEWFDGRVAYAGSPNRCNFGEVETKGWRLVTLSDDGEFLSNEFIELPARRITLIERALLPSVEEHGLWSPDDPFALLEEPREIQPGDLVRVRYRVRSEDLHRIDESAVIAAAERAGASEVKLEAIVEHDTRTRAPEIVELRSTAEKLDAFLRAKAIDVTDEQRERLHAKLSVLEGGAHATQ